MRNTLLFFTMVFFLVSCEKKPPSPDELYEKYRGSVVLIKNEYYHKAILDNDLEFYFTEGPEGIELFMDEEEARDNSMIAYGSGFFIDSEGKIATNRHVVYPEGDFRVFQLIDDYIVNLKNEMKADYSSNTERMEKLSSYYNEYFDYLDYGERSELEEEYEKLKEENKVIEEVFPKLEFNERASKIELVQVDLAIAYDNTFVENDDDYISCVPIRKSEREEIDLAIIQLKNKRTPAEITSFFELPSMEELPQVKMSEDIYMIGYNQGVNLAQTKEGVKSQFTTGNVSQDPDSDRILYSIPTLGGSSGSPIFNSWGDLIAVNFAKTRDYQGFSFGVPVKNLVQLYRDIPLTEAETRLASTPSESESIPTASTKTEVEEKIDYSSKIRGLLDAEERRNFDEISSYFSPNMKRYWNVSYPTKEELYKQYTDSWDIILSASNRILEIERLNKFNYILHTDYEYTLRESKNQKSTRSEVRYKFNEEGKIVEIYGI